MSSSSKSKAKATLKLHAAIRSNSPTLLKELLETGSNANSLIGLQKIHADDSEDTTWKDYWLASSAPLSTVKASLCHLAVANCYFNHGKPDDSCSIYYRRAKNARAILQLLIEHGADVQRESSHILVCNIEGYKWKPLTDTMNGTPLELALFYKQHLHEIELVDQGSFMDKVVGILQKAARASGDVKVPMVQVPKSTFATWEALLLSETFSDVRFVCAEGGEELPAHKAVLATASDYFHALFTGPWADTHADGAVATSNSPLIMRALLSFVYTGSMDEELLESNCEELVGVASEYCLAELRALAERRCIRSLSLENIRRMLELAHLHEAPELKEACVTFTKRNAATVLTDPQMMSLAAEQPGLWADLVSKISSAPPAVASSSSSSSSSSNQPKKKQRTKKN